MILADPKNLEVGQLYFFRPHFGSWNPDSREKPMLGVYLGLIHDEKPWINPRHEVLGSSGIQELTRPGWEVFEL